MMAPHGDTRGLEDSPVLRIGLEGNPEAPSLARAAIAGFFEDREIDPSALSTLTLLVSELVSNAVVHSSAAPSSEILLCVRLLEPSDLRVEVTDQGAGFTPVARDPARIGGGYGLYLVDKQAERWGVDRKGGTRVWFEMPYRQAA
jgi:anti-sigma regulatory factor (Ser/Thr protein kinase)